MITTFLSLILQANSGHVEALDNQVVYIKNSYAVGAYLYEDSEGTLRYGIPLKNEQSFQWILNKTSKGVTIQNKFTSHFITLKSFLGNNTDPVKCLLLDENDDHFYWDVKLDVEENESQNISSKSAEYEGYVLHLEGITNGQVAAEKLSGDNLSWGNVRWLLKKESEINFDAIIRDGFCILNNLSQKYLYEVNGEVKYGVPTSPDDAYIWLIEVQADDSKLIKNKKSGKYLSMDLYDSLTSTLGTASSVTKDLGKWDFSISVQTTIKSKSTDYVGYGLMINATSDTSLNAKALTSIATQNKLWSVLSASSVKNAVGDLVLDDKIYNLKNAWFSMYLIEDNGMATYGNAKTSDPYAQWKIIYDSVSKKTKLQNVGSGNYLHAGDGENGLIIDNKEIYYWYLLRNKSDLYPEAVVFQDSTDSTKYLHMEALNGYAENSNAVQPNWGTPHWIPIVYDATKPNATFEKVEMSNKFVRIKSVYGTDNYLYETAAGGLAYGKIGEKDARSHWQFEESANGYYLKNRKYINYIANMGNGVIRTYKKVDDIVSGGEFVLYVDDTTKEYVICNYYTGLKDYLQPYLNISSLSGLAKSSLVPVDAKTTKWTIIDALDVEEENPVSELGNVDLTVIEDTNVYKIVNGSKTLDGIYSIEYYGSSARIQKEGTDLYLYNNNGKLEYRKISNPYDAKLLFTLTDGLGATYAKNGTLQLKLNKTATKAVYKAQSNFVYNDYRSFAVNAQQGGNYQISLELTTSSDTRVYINGYDVGLYSDSNNTFYLNKGINTIKVSNAINVTALNVYDSYNINYRGATVDYVTFEAELMETNGKVLDEDRTYRTIASESSRRSAVILDGTTQYVRFVLTENTNALVIRYSIPDTLDGVGQDATLNLYIDNAKKTAINMTSRFTHLYGAYPWTNNPSDGNVHVYYDEVKVMLDQVYPAGTVIKLQKDVSNYAKSYVIDFVETSLVEGANQKPLNAVSITDYGAIANDNISDLNALLTAIEVAHASNKEVWIPEGQFIIDQPITISYDNLIIRGAGRWHTSISGGVVFFINADNVEFYDFALNGVANTRRDSEDRAAFEVKKNTAKGLVIQNLWITHYKCGFWLSYIDDVYIVGNRVRYTYADGLNLHAGVVNGVVEQNDFISTGDDTIGLWSQGVSNLNIVVKNNTIKSPWLANAVGVYGGTNISVIDNIMLDTIYAGAGVNISSNFQPTPFAGSIKVLRNSIIRCGSDNNTFNVGGIWFNTVLGYDNKATNTVSDNLVLNSTYQGIYFGGGGLIKNIKFDKNVVLSSGTWGLDISSASSGNLVATNNLIDKSMLENIKNNSTKFASDISVEYIKTNNVVVSKWNPTKLVIFGVINVLFIAFISYALIYFKKAVIKTSKGGN
jgi:hypothetical protein